MFFLRETPSRFFALQSRRRRGANTAPESALTATPAAEPAELEPEEPWAPPPLPPAQPMLSRILGREDLTPTAYDKALSPEDILSFVRPAFSPAATHFPCTAP